MKNKKVTLLIDGDTVRIKYKRKNNISQLQAHSHVHYGGTLSSPMLNVIGVSESVYNELNGSGLILFNADNGKYIDVVITPADIRSDSIKVTGHIKEYLDILSDTELLILKNNTYSYTNIKIQKIDNIKEDYIVISDKDNDDKPIDLNRFAFFQMFNYYTGASLIIKRSHIKIDKKLKKGTVLLNRKQRTFLDAELPKSISKQFWTELTSRIPQENSDDVALLNECYSDEDRFLKDGLSYEKREKLKKTINKYCEPHINIFPIADSYCHTVRRGFKAIADFYVGKSTVSLLCRRPYESDEGSDVVRMTVSNMNILGIAEMDKVILKYKDKSVACRVLKLDDEKAFAEANLPTPLNYAIGVPAHIRKKLGIHDVHTAVKVDRDTTFIFKKSVNEQVVPILLTVFSINLFQDPSIWKKALVSLLAIPIVVYLNLSSKRNMRG